MSNNPYEESKFAHFSSSKGFYAVMAACLIGAGASGAYFLTKDNAVKDAPQPMVQNDEIENEEKPIEPIKSQEIVFKTKEEKPDNPPPEQEKNDSKKEEISVSKTAFMGMLPCKGEVRDGFSNGELVKDETMGDWRTHNGVDIMASEGSDVVAFSSGKVRDIRNDALWGTVVEIEHPGAVISKYCGLSENVQLTKGDSVKAGDKIGNVGFIPAESAKGAHLHFELTEKGKYKNPMEFIK